MGQSQPPSPSPDPIDELRQGLAGRYDIERELGAGGMAVVYLARDRQHDRQVALKVLRSELGIVRGGDRFHHEIRLVARMVHPHILPLLDSGETAGRLWYSMPYIDGESLRARLVREKRLPIDEAIRLTREIAEALSYAHGRGILHRDIKPENILLSAGHALVTDFGIARAITPEAETRLTSTSIAVGTPGYMSPEQSSGSSDLDARSDLYSLGCVGYEMLVGEQPFTGPTPLAVMARRFAEPPPSIRASRPEVPLGIDTALRRALAPAPEDRFDSTAAFADALGAAPPSTARPNQRSTGRWSLVVGLGILVVALITYRVVHRPVLAAVSRAPHGTVRLAVVPLRLLGSDPGDQYLADGITEEINSALSNLGGLRVLAQSSVVPAARTGKSSRELGTALGADALIQGDVQRAGSAVRVRVALIDPTTEETRWSERYDHTTQDVFRLQSEIAAKVVGLLRIQLAERESRSLGRLPTTNPEAYDSYLRARLPGNPTRVMLDSAIARMSRAVELDPRFAAAFARRASILTESVFLYDTDPAQLDQAEADVRTALALDSTLAVAWAARADLEWNAIGGWHFPEALGDFRHAVALQPSYARAHNQIGVLYSHYGFLPEAQRELDISLSLDPEDSCDNPARCEGYSRPRVARVLWYRQRFDSALSMYRSLPFVGGFVWEYAVVLNGVGRPADGLALLDSARVAGKPENGDREAARALLTAALGRRAEALDHIRAAIAIGSSRSHFHHAQFTIATAYARLGRTPDAVSWLRSAANNGMPNYPLFRNDPNLRSLQGDPEYEALMAQLERQHESYARLVRQ